MARKITKTEQKRLEQQKQALLDKKEDLISRLSFFSDEGKNTERKGDSSDLASTSRDEELNFLLGDRERQELKVIDDALKRFEDGSYGICEGCGERVSHKRLEALPFARHCLDCQAEMEIIDKQAAAGKSDRIVNLFSDVVKLTDLETDDTEDGKVPTAVNEFTKDIISTEINDDETKDIEEDDEESDKS